MIRDLFRTMPPMRHDRDRTRSQVILHIMQSSGGTIEQAERSFHYLRKKGHLVFVKAGRLWHGIDYIPDESEAQFRVRISAEVTTLRISLEAANRLLAKLRESHNNLIKEVRGDK